MGKDEIELIKATFGSFNKSSDVTDIIRNKINDRIYIDGFGIPDPDPNTIKHLDITYKICGKIVNDKIIAKSYFPRQHINKVHGLLKQLKITEKVIYDFIDRTNAQLYRNNIILAAVDLRDRKCIVFSIPHDGAGLYCYVNYYVWAIYHFLKSCYDVDICVFDGFSLYKDRQTDNIYDRLFQLGQENGVEKYFSASDNVLQKIEYLKNIYNITYDFIGVIYRGTDKQKECRLPKVESYIEKISQLPNLPILLQTDEESVCAYFKQQFKNRCVVFDEIPRSSDGRNVFHKDNINNKSEIISYFDASIRIISRCKFVIANSSNITTAMCMYRGHHDGVFKIRGSL